jgi:predicted transcriptional regulator
MMSLPANTRHGPSLWQETGLPEHTREYKTPITDYSPAPLSSICVHAGMSATIATVIAIDGGPVMKTVQMTLDEQLVKAVDSAARKLGTTRSGFTREALRSALKEVRVKELELQHREGYKRKPVKRGEFSEWESEQVWGD